MASPTTAPRPMTRLNTPAGSPERLRMSASAQPQPGARGLAGRLRRRLALLAREQLAQLGAAREDLGADEIERVEALLRRGDGPGGECRARRRDGGVHRGGIA